MRLKEYCQVDEGTKLAYLKAVIVLLYISECFDFRTFFLHVFSFMTFRGRQNGANVWPGVEAIRAYFSLFFRVYFCFKCCQIT